MDLLNSKFVYSERRLNWIDYDKGISIILVGYAHCFFTLKGYGPNLEAYPIINDLDVFLYGFRMPLFFIISGMFIAKSLNKKSLSGYISARADTILYPLFVWGIFEITLKIINARFNPNIIHEGSNWMDYLYLIINPRVTGHFWYLNTLFCIGVIYAVLKSKLKWSANFQIVLGLALYAFSSYIHINELNYGLITDICEYYFFFALGDLISDIVPSGKNIKRSTLWLMFVPLVIAFFVVQYFCWDINIKKSLDGISYVEHRLPHLYLAQVLVGCAFSVILSFLLQEYKAFKFLRIIGYHSLYVYAMQIIAMTFARIIFYKICKISYVPVLFILVWASGVLLPIVFYNFCLRFNLWRLFTFKKPARQVEYLRNNNIFSFKESNSLSSTDK